MNCRFTLFAFFFLFFTFQIIAQDQQKISIDVVQQPLSSILLDLREDYGFKFAYDDDLISGYNLTLTQTFSSPKELIENLLRDLPLSFEMIGDVFIITKKQAVPEESKLIQFSGIILDKQTSEILPFSHVIINGKQLISDQQGQFTYKAYTDTTFSVKISHLGYYIYDSVFYEGFNQKYYLTPSSKELDEVLVKKYQFEKSTMVGDKPGKMKLNHIIAPYLPGYSDNTVYSILRLMPGVLASGEQSSDLLIWGSFEGQTKVQLDGFTLFGLKNFNDNIGAVNPLVVKNMEIYKGGYEAKYGDRVGGLVNVIGKNGQMSRPALTLSINNSTINSFLEVPLSEKSSLTAAFRTTYYELYDPSKLNILGTTRGNSSKVINVQTNQGKATGKGKGQGQGQGNNDDEEVVDQPSVKDTLIDLNAQPDYKFMDANLKYTFRGSDGSLVYISLYGGGDDFLYKVEGDFNNSNLLREETENNIQKGGSAYWGKSWRNGLASNIIVNYSALDNSSSIFSNFNSVLNDGSSDQSRIEVENNISEYSLRNENTWSLYKGHNVGFGFGYVLNDIVIKRKLFDSFKINRDNRSERIFSYIQDNLPLGENIVVNSGVRMNYSTSLQKFFIDPRISITYNIVDKWKFNAGCGIYHQFISKTMVMDSTVNYSLFWTVANNADVQVSKSEHILGGLAYDENNFTFSIEGYYKSIDGLNRFVSGVQDVDEGFYTGDGRSYGLDLYLRKSYKNNMIWVGYTLSKTEERFSYQLFDIYRPALHDQRHELKLAGILNIKSFYFSANYVYGSGFEQIVAVNDDGSTYLPKYSRLDIASVYRFNPGNLNVEAGISVLNILNHQNIKYSNLTKVQADEQSFFNVYSEAIPFSPMLFLKMQF